MNRMVTTIVATMAAMMSTVSARAQAWAPTSGPEGGSVVTIAAMDTAVLAVTTPGVLYQSDGTGWVRLGRTRIQKLHALGSLLIAEGPDSLYRSTDLGGSWRSVGPTGFGVRIAIDESRLYAAVDSAIYRSIDSGATWSRIAFTGMDFFSFLVHDSTILIGRGVGAGLYRSADLGKSWERVTAGLPEGDALWAFHRHGTAIIAALDAHGVMRSTDDGATWSAINEGLPTIGGSYPIFTDFVSIGERIWGTGRNGTFAYVGGRWYLQSAEDDRAIASLDGLVLRGSRQGFTMVGDTGRSWRSVNMGLKAHSIDAIARYGNAVLASAAGMIYRTTNLGGSWTAAKDIEVTRFAAAEGIVYAVGKSFLRNGIFRSVDGLDWGEVGSGLPYPMRWLGGIGARGDTVFAGFNHIDWEDNQEIWIYGGVYRSVDRGATWQAMNAGLPNDGHGDVPVRDVIMLDHATLLQTADGVYRWSDANEMWERTQPVLVSSNLPGISAHAGTVAYIVAGGDVYGSSDDGATWSRVGKEGVVNGTITHLSSVHGQLYAAVTIDGISGSLYRLSSGVWIDITGQLPPEVGFQSLVEMGDTVLAGTACNSVWSGRLDPVAGVPDEMPRADAIELEAAPNPLRADGIVRFTLAEPAHVRLSLISSLGEEVALLREGRESAGTHEIPLDVQELAAGLYHLRIVSGGRVSAVPVVKLR